MTVFDVCQCQRCKTMPWRKLTRTDTGEWRVVVGQIGLERWVRA